MKKVINLILAIITATLLSGCGLNAATRLTPYDLFPPEKDDAVIIYGAGVTSPIPEPWAVNLGFAEFDIQKHRIVGSCHRFNHTSVNVSDMEAGKIEYFVFSVPPGYYTFNTSSGVLSGSKSNPKEFLSSGFHAPAGEITYLGDIIAGDLHEEKSKYGGTAGGIRDIVIKSNIDAAQHALEPYSFLKKKIHYAGVTPVGLVNHSGVFVCFP